MQLCQSSVSRNVVIGLQWPISPCVKPIEAARRERVFRFLFEMDSVEFTIAKVVILKWPLFAASERHS
jgi:hypothetical protein